MFSISYLFVLASLTSCFAQIPQLYRQKSPKSSSFSPSILAATPGKLVVPSNEQSDQTADAQSDGGGFGSENIGFGELGVGGGGGGEGGKFFMDGYMIQTGPKQVEFGHVSESPFAWEQRYERKDHDKKRFQGQVLYNLTINVLSLARYAHNPAEDHYEFGYKRGNGHHFTERHEKAHPHAGQFKTHARWGDKHGGYGEHYWDYNHGDHHQGEENDGAGDESQTISEVTRASMGHQSTTEKDLFPPKYSSRIRDFGKSKRQYDSESGQNNMKEIRKNLGYRQSQRDASKTRDRLLLDEMEE